MFHINEEALSQDPNAYIRHLFDSLVSVLAVYATAFRSELSLPCPLFLVHGNWAEDGVDSDLSA